MQKNDIIELKIEDMGVDGEGIGKYDGMTFFVKDAVLGDEIEARITKMKKNYGYARVEQILSPSKFRVTPQCELHRRCGGCQIQALDYEKQLEFKQNKVRGNLIRIGGFAPELIDRIMLPVDLTDTDRSWKQSASLIAVDRNKLSCLCMCCDILCAKPHAVNVIRDLFLPDDDRSFLKFCTLCLHEFSPFINRFSYSSYTM